MNTALIIHNIASNVNVNDGRNARPPPTIPARCYVRDNVRWLPDLRVFSVAYRGIVIDRANYCDLVDVIAAYLKRDYG